MIKQVLEDGIRTVLLVHIKDLNIVEFYHIHLFKLLAGETLTELLQNNCYS